MDKAEVSIAVSMGLGTVQGFTTFLGSVNTSDILDDDAYKRGVGLSLGWTFLVSCAVAGWSNTYSPLVAWLVTSGAMLSAYEYNRDRAYGKEG